MRTECDFECDHCAEPCYKARHTASLDKIRKLAAAKKSQSDSADN